MAEPTKRSREADEDEVPLYYILELVFNGEPFIYRDQVQNLLAQTSKLVPLTLMRPWRNLRQLLEAWITFQTQMLPNQEHHEEEYQKIYSPLRAGHCSYSQFRSEEELCMMSFPPETAERLRTFVMKLLDTSSSDQPSMPSQPSLSTHETRPFHTSTPYTTAAGPMEAVGVLPSLAMCDDQTARQFGLQASTSGTSPILSSICIVSPEHWNTLKWEEPTGVQTLELQLWDNIQVRDTNPQEFWKYSKHKFRVQLHATAPQEVHKAVETLSRYAHDKVRRAENVQKHRKMNPSMTTYDKTPYRR